MNHTNYKIKQKNYKYLIQVCLSFEATFSMMENNLLNIQTVHYTLKRLGNTEKIVPGNSKGLSTEKCTTPTTTDNSFGPSIQWYRNSNYCQVFKDKV